MVRTISRTGHTHPALLSAASSGAHTRRATAVIDMTAAGT